MIKNVYFNPVAKGYNIFNGCISIIMLVLGIIILISAMRKWKELLSKSPAQRRAAATETVAEQLS
jgi:carbon starvation protein